MNNLQTLSSTLLLVLPLLAISSCQQADTQGRISTLLPPATGGDPELASGQNEEDNQEKRREWMEQRHRTAPGVDWRAIEAENARAAAARKELAQRARGATSGAWAEVGSRNQAGNILTSARTDDGNTLYLGSALGGVWKGSASGDDWKSRWPWRRSRGSCCSTSRLPACPPMNAAMCSVF